MSLDEELDAIQGLAELATRPGAEPMQPEEQDRFNLLLMTHAHRARKAYERELVARRKR